MVARSRMFLLALVGALVLSGLVIGTAEAKAKPVPKVTGLAAAGSNLNTAKLGVRWKKVTGATYQVRWSTSTKTLSKAKVYTSKTTSTLSPALSNFCATWYAQVRAKKGTKFGAWSAAKGLKFSGTSGVAPATPITSGQTSSSAAKVSWTKRPGAAGYRVYRSPTAFGNWPGYFPYTAASATTTSVSIPLPAVAEGDRFMGVQYGNPLFVQLQTLRCNGVLAKAPFAPVWPKALPAGDAKTGSALRFGAYNVEGAPQAGNPKIAVLASQIADANLDVLALQEGNDGTADALIDQLGTEHNQADWASYGLSQQQVLWRTSKWTSVNSYDIGELVDGTAATALPTPLVQLTPAVADPAKQDIFVASVHLEDRKKFFPAATNAEQKQDAHDAAAGLITKINAVNTGLPTLVAGDLKGNFGGGGQPATTGQCDESSTPACVGEGQPTFVRAGYLDARGAASKSGIQYGTVNGHVFPQVASNSGVGGRADFILVKGFTGISKYVHIPNLSNTNSPSDHNLLYADLFVPFVP